MGKGIEGENSPQRIQPRRKGNALANALLALGLVTGASDVNAQSEKDKQSWTPRIIAAPALAKRPEKSPTGHAWFKEKLQSLKVNARELAMMEEFIEQDKIPLATQIKFIETTLQPGGVLYRDLHAKDLSLARFSNILKIVNKVSARLTAAYEHNRQDPSLAAYFDIGKLRNANRHDSFELVDEKKKPGKTHRGCNGSLFVTGQDVYFRTAKHCVIDTKREGEFRTSKVADLAIRYVSPKEYKRYQITDPSELPVFSEGMTTAEASSGRVVATFGFGPDEPAEKLIAKTDFSFLLPLPEMARKHLYNANDLKKHSFVEHSMIFIKPPSEGRVLSREQSFVDQLFDKPGEVTRVGGSGFSGEGVAVHGGDAEGFRDLGAFQSVTILDDTCRSLCYAVSTVSSPKPLTDLIIEDRGKRLQTTVLREQKQILESLDEPPVPIKRRTN